MLSSLADRAKKAAAAVSSAAASAAGSSPSAESATTASEDQLRKAALAKSHEELADLFVRERKKTRSLQVAGTGGEDGSVPKQEYQKVVDKLKLVVEKYRKKHAEHKMLESKLEGLSSGAAPAESGDKTASPSSEVANAKIRELSETNEKLTSKLKEVVARYKKLEEYAKDAKAKRHEVSSGDAKALEKKMQS